MKKLAFILATAMLISLVGCTATTGVTQAEYDELKAKYEEVVKERDSLLEAMELPETWADTQVSAGDTNLIPFHKFDEETVLSQLSVTEYAYSTRYSDYGFLVIKNNSEFTLEVSAAVKFYNANGDLIGADNRSENAVGSGTETVLEFYVDEDFTRMEYELSAKEDDWYESVASYLSYESVSAKEKEIVSVTNNSTETAEFVYGYALFFNGGKLVDHVSSYFVDDDFELKPGKTITKEMNCYEEYDSVKFVFIGRRYK